MTRSGVAIAGVSWFAISLLAGTRPAAAEPVEGHPAPAGERPADDEPPFRCKAHPGPVVVTFKADAEVKDLITWVMGFTCKNVLLDPRVTATGRKVSIVTPSPMSPDDAYQVFLAALATINLTVVTRGNTLRIVEASATRPSCRTSTTAGSAAWSRRSTARCSTPSTTRPRAPRSARGRAAWRPAASTPHRRRDARPDQRRPATCPPRAWNRPPNPPTTTRPLPWK